MPNKPTTVPQLDTNQTNRTVPAPSKVSDGFVLNDILPAANANYLWGWMGDWLGWLDATFEDGAAAGDLRINGIVGLEDTPVTGTNIGQKLNVQWDADPANNIGAATFQTDVKSLTANRNAWALQTLANNADTVDTYDVTWLAGHWSQAGVTNVGTCVDVEAYGAYVFNSNASGDITGKACGYRVWPATATGTIAENYGLRVDPQSAGTANYGVWVGNCNPGYSIWVDGGTVALGPGLMTHLDTGTFSTWDAEAGWKSIAQSAHTATSSEYGWLFETSLASTTGGAFGGIVVAHVPRHTANSTGWTPGIWCEVTFDPSAGGGTVGEAESYGAGVYNLGAGTITSGHGLRVYNGANSGGGTFTNQYGVRIENLTAAANNYGLYIGGASTYSIWVDSGECRFDGNVGIGPVNPETLLHLYGSDVSAPAGGTMLTLEKNDSVVVNLLSSNAAGKLAGFWFGDADATATGRFEYYHDINRMDWWTANVRFMVLTNIGRLGLGTNFTDPDSKLHVQVGSAGVNPASGTVITAENNGDGYISVLTPAANMGGLICGDPGDSDAGRWLYHHADTLPGWACYVEGLLQMKLDSGRRMWLGYGEDYAAQFSGSTVPGDAQLLNICGDASASGNAGVAFFNNVTDYAIMAEGSTGALRIFEQGATEYNYLVCEAGSLTGGVQVGPANTDTYCGIGLVPTISDGVLQLDTTGAKLSVIHASATGTVSSAAGYIRVKVGATTKYIPLYSSQP